MDLFFDILTAAGLGAAIGIRPLLPVLLAGVLAVANLGIDFEGTSFSWLEGTPFLLVVLVLVVAVDVVDRRSDPAGGARRPATVAIGVLAVALGALEGAGTVADHDGPVVVGGILGGLAALAAVWIAGALLRRVRRRLGQDGGGLVGLYAEGAALVAAAGSILLPPLAVVVVGLLVWLAVGSRRRQGEKYAGLRVLR